MNRRRRARWVAGAGLLALAATACGGGGGETDDPAAGHAETPGGQGGTLRLYASEPAFLIPGNTNESAGSAVLNALYSPLLDYDQETGEPFPVVAAELPTSEDNVTWTITVADGWTFHDGEPVTAQSFVDAWNFTAYSPNANANSYFFGPGMADVVGFGDTQSEDPDDDGPQEAPAPAAETMSGLQVIDEQTFTATLSAPFSQFPLMLGYTAFYPMATACLEDLESCNEAPVGNGPFMMDGVWEHNQGINVVRYQDWGGETPPNVGAVEFRIYTEPTTAYLDLQDGNIDYMNPVPTEQLAEAKELYGDRFVQSPSSTFAYIGFPMYDPEWGGTPEDGYGGEEKANLRKALSMAINREELIETVFNGAFQPADSLVSPVVNGYREGSCGEACGYDVEAARELYEQSSKVDGPIQIWFNQGGGHDAWMEAVANYWQAAFGIEYELEAEVWASYLERRSASQMTGPFRLSWSMDYPSAQNYIAPIYGEGAGLPDLGYNSQEANDAMRAGNSAGTIDEGLARYNAAEDIVLDTFPVIPIYFGNNLAAYNENLSGVVVDKFSNIDLLSVSLDDAG